MTNRTLKRKVWINLALTAMVGALVVLVVLEPGKEAPAPPTPLTERSPADVGQVTIRRPGQPVIRLERTEAGWRMAEPRDLRASTGKIENLLRVLGAESRRRFDADALDADQAGLAEPEAILELDGTRLVFGGTDPIGGNRYVRVGDTVHLIGGRYLAQVRNPTLYWADNALLPGDASITGIELPDVTLTLDEKGLWHAEPEPADLSADALVGMVQAWENASALSVRAAGGTPPGAARVRLHLDGRHDPIIFDLVDNRAGFELIRQDLGLRYTMTEPQRAELLVLGPPDPDPGPAAPSAEDDPAG